jgi:hypothetical protein
MTFMRPMRVLRIMRTKMTKETAMATAWLRGVGVGVLVSCLGAGCAGTAAPTGEEMASIRPADLPNLPGCGTEHPAQGPGVARAIAGFPGLYVIYVGGQPLCIDTLEAAARSLHTWVSLDPASSNPMPGDDGRHRSNPMPGTIRVQSNPMPGDDPAASNPMPGDDANSNPMPGTPTAQTIWTTKN